MLLKSFFSLAWHYVSVEMIVFWCPVHIKEKKNQKQTKKVFNLIIRFSELGFTGCFSNSLVKSAKIS